VAQVTLGEQTVASSTDVQETPSAHALHHDRRANHHGHRLLQRSASAHHGNRYHGNQLRRGPTQPLHPHALAPDKPLVRRKRIRRDKSTSLVAGKEAHALEQAVASGHSTLSTAEMLPDKSKPKPVHAGKSHRRKLFRGRGRGRPLHNSLMSMEMAHRGNLGDRKRQRLIRRLGGTSSPSEHRHGQKAREQRPLVASGHHLMFRTRNGKMPISQTGKPRASTSSIPDSVVDEFHAHPLAVHRVGAVARRRPSASGSGARRRRLPVVHRSTAGLHHGAVGREVSQPLKHGITASRRRTSTPHIRSNDGYQKPYINIYFCKTIIVLTE